MATLSVYKETGEVSRTIEVPEAVFGVRPVLSLIHQVYIILLGNQREPWAHTKDKSEVRGGGKKPWRQKGTGRARHGSIRSPIWKGGGITFGPRNVRNYARRLSSALRRRAVAMCLTDKAESNHFFVVESFPNDGKTKTLAGLLAHLPLKEKQTLLIQSGDESALLRSARNIPFVSVVRAEDANVIDLLHHERVLATPTVIDALSKRLGGHTKTKTV